MMLPSVPGNIMMLCRGNIMMLPWHRGQHHDVVPGQHHDVVPGMWCILPLDQSNIMILPRKVIFLPLN